jgi:hypothetical protein
LSQSLFLSPQFDRLFSVSLYIKEIRTVPRPREGAREELRLPERFGKLKPEQQSGALTALEAVDAALHQAILDEWDARCRANTVRQPASYLFGNVQKALRGDFHAWAADKEPDKPPKAPDKPPETPETPEIPAEKAQPGTEPTAKAQAESRPTAEEKPASAETAQKYLAQFRAMLRQSRPP